MTNMIDVALLLYPGLGLALPGYEQCRNNLDRYDNETIIFSWGRFRGMQLEGGYPELGGQHARGD